MTTNAKVSDRQWLKMVAFLPAQPRVYVGQEAHCRLFVEAVHWVMRSGAQWRFLPQEYGHWNSVYKRYGRWCDHAVWEERHQYFADDPDMENLMLDSSVVRAHPAAAGAPQKTVARRAKPWVALEAASPARFM